MCIDAAGCPRRPPVGRRGSAAAPRRAAIGSAAWRNGADRLGLVDAEHDTLAEIKVVVNAVLAHIAGAQILAEDKHAEPRIDYHGALDRRLVDAARAQPPQMFELQHVGAG